MLQRTVTSASSVLLNAASRGELDLVGDSSESGHKGASMRTLGDMLRTPPHKRGAEVVEEIEHALTKWSRYGVDMPRAARLELCKHMGFAAFDAEEVIFRQGDTGEHFYIILSGAVDVSVNDAGDEQGEKVVAHLMAGASFGELALMQGHGQRRATCRCSQKTELFVVDIKDFKRILQPLQQDTLQSKISFLKNVPVFKVLPASVVESLAVVLTEKMLPPRSVVYYQGNEVEELFFIQRGHVKMVRETDMEPKARSRSPSRANTPRTAPSTARSAAPSVEASVAPSVIPAWLMEEEPKRSPRHSEACKAARTARSATLRASGGGRPRQALASAENKAVPLSYHKLSLDLIKSMSGDRFPLDSKPAPSRAQCKAGAAGKRPSGYPATHPPAPAFKSPVKPALAAPSLSGVSTQRVVPRLRFADGISQDAKVQQVADGSVTERSLLLSERSLDVQIMQGMDYTRNVEAKQHLFLEIDYLSKADFFGDVSVLKSPIAQTTAVTASMTTTLWAISKWDLVKRVPKDLVDFLADRARASVINDTAVRSQYKACQEWLRFKKVLVKDIVKQQQVCKNNNPMYVWQGPFRPSTPCPNPKQAMWRPTGLPSNRPATCC